jgi:dienelactone hydrolase
LNDYEVTPLLAWLAIKQGSMGNFRVNKYPMIRLNCTNSLLRSSAAGLLLLLAVICPAFAQEFVTGKVIGKVATRKDDRQSYALYLPTSYTPTKRFPIIYAFDPGAHGSLPVERFREAAEKHGYIVAGSNNSRNGPDVPLSEIITAFLDDTQSRLAIDERRVYTTGFSGGARVAGLVAFSLKGQIAGVIGCGAGFPTQAKPTKDLPFAYYGIAGSDDFNLTEVRQLARTLDGLSAPVHFAVFEGGHAWPPAVFCTEAVAWMELQAMKSGRRERDDKLIAELLIQQTDRLRADEVAKKTFDVYLRADALAKDFQGLANVTEFAIKAEQLKNAKEVKEGFRREKADEQLEQKTLRDFYGLRERLKAEELRTAVISDLRSFLTGLRKDTESSMPGSKRSIARRALANFWVLLIEEAAQLRFQKKHSETAATLMLAAEIRPDNPQIFFGIARALALAKNRKDALEALKKAVEKGFSNLDELKTNPDLETIRSEQAYKQLIETLSKKNANVSGSSSGEESHE